jgi:tetratricopeptide (TPR) repeat protein
MPDENPNIKQFQSIEEFFAWWDSPEITELRRTNPTGFAVLEEHPFVKPWLVRQFTPDPVEMPESRPNQAGKPVTPISGTACGLAPVPASATGPASEATASGGDKAAANAQPIGKTFGKYRLEKKLGQGGMGAVYLAYDASLNRRIALKVLLSADKESVERFLREARATAKLRHHNIIQVYEVGTIDKRNYLTMDYIDGTSLDALIKGKRSKLSPKRVVEIIYDVAQALAYAHSQNIIHRDIKPANILIATPGSKTGSDQNLKVYLTDFGLAKEMNASGRSLTLSGTVVGTPDYMSPEQARGDSKKIDRRSDIFSLGATFYHALTGRPAFHGKELYEVLESVVHKDPVTPRSIVPTLNRDIETICLKCMEKDPRKRYQAVAELAQDLNRYLEGEEIVARPAGFLTGIIKRMKKNKMALAASIAAVAIILGVAVTTAISSLRKNSAIEDYRRQAESYFDKGKFEEARLACEKILALAPVDEAADELSDKCTKAIKTKNDAVSEARAKARAILDRASLSRVPMEIIRVAQEALKIDPTLGEAYQAMAYAYKEAKDLNKAIEFFNKAINTTPSLAYSYYERGNLYLLAGRVQLANADFENVLKYDPESYLGYVSKGRIAMHHKRYDEAVSLLNKALELNPNFGQAYINRGVAYYELGQIDKSIEDYTTGISKDPWIADSYCNRGISYSEQGKIPEALNDMGIAVRLEPNDARYYICRAKVHHKNGDYQSAIQDTDSAITKNPKFGEAYIIRANIYLCDNQLEKALADAREAANLEPSKVGAYEMLGLVYSAQKDYDQAITAFNKYLSLDASSASVYGARGTAYYSKMDYDRALADLNEAIKLDPNDLIAYLNRSSVYQAKGDTDKAIKDLDYALRLGIKDSSYYYKRLAQLYKDKNDFDKGIAMLTKAIVTDPRNYDAYNHRGMLYGTKEEYDKAISDFTEAIRLKPGFLLAYTNRAYTYSEKKNYDKAIADYNEAISISPTATYSLLNRGCCYMVKNEPDKAMSDFNEIIRLDPGYGLAYHNRARIYAARKDFASAIADGERALSLNPTAESARNMKIMISSWRYLSGQ